MGLKRPQLGERNAEESAPVSHQSIPGRMAFAAALVAALNACAPADDEGANMPPLASMVSSPEAVQKQPILQVQGYKGNPTVVLDFFHANDGITFTVSTEASESLTATAAPDIQIQSFPFQFETAPNVIQIEATNEQGEQINIDSSGEQGSIRGFSQYTLPEAQ